ncbi:MAG: alginate lyase family protein, partial [Novosphingobium sp.]
MARRCGVCALLAGLSLLAAGPAHAAGQALVGPRFLASPAPRPLPPMAAAVVDRARQALAIPIAPLKGILREGLLPAQMDQAANDAAYRDLAAMADLAMAWRLTQERRYLVKAGALLANWADTYPLTLNPIDETALHGVIVAYDLTEADLPQATRGRVDTFLWRLATRYLEGMETGKVERPQTLTNNWQSHRVKLATLAAFQLGDPALIARARTAFEKQIAANLKPDGPAMDFAMRDALHYVVFSVEPLLIAALAAKQNGQDWYTFRTPQGAGLPRTLDWLAEFARGEKSHIEYANSVVPFDRQRRDAGVAGFANEPWKPAEAAQVFALATVFDPRFAPVRDRLGSANVERWILLYDSAAPAAGASPRPPIAMMGAGLRSTDLARSTRFYTEGLGLTVAGNLQTEMYDEVILDFGGSRTPPLILLLKFRSGKSPPPRTTAGAPEKIILTVADAEALAARLKAAGYAPSAVNHNVAAKLKQFFVSDPDGNRFE